MMNDTGEMSANVSATPHNFNLTADIVFGVIELFASLIAFSLNSLTVRFFFGKKTSPTYFLYLCIVTVDILTGLVTFPSAISMLYGRKMVLFRNSFLCIFSGWVLNITTRMSVYLVAVLSVIRCVTIHPTLSSPSLRHAIIPVVIYLVIQVGQASLPLIFSSHDPPIYFHDSVGACSWGIDDLTIIKYEDGQGFWYQFLVYFCLIIPSLLPIIPVLVCCVIFVKILVSSKQRMLRYCSNTKSNNNNNTLSISNIRSYLKGTMSHCSTQPNQHVPPQQQSLTPQAFLLPRSVSKTSVIELAPSSQSQVNVKQNEKDISLSPQPVSPVVKPFPAKKSNKVRTASQKQGGATTHQATTTMYIVTAMYVVFNVPFWIFLLIVMFFGQSDHIAWVSNHYSYIHIFVYRTSVALNAACNPIVYFTRMRALRTLWWPKNAILTARNFISRLVTCEVNEK